jgi:hypothetical protein
MVIIICLPSPPKVRVEAAHTADCSKDYDVLKMLCKTRHKRTNAVWLYLHEAPRTGKFVEIHGEVEVHGDCRGGDDSYCLIEIISILDDEKHLEMDDGKGCTTL